MKFVKIGMFLAVGVILSMILVVKPAKSESGGGSNVPQDCCIACDPEDAGKKVNGLMGVMQEPPAYPACVAMSARVCKDTCPSL